MSDTSGVTKISLATEPNTDSYINTGGNFGIGTITPNAKLTVNGNIEAWGLAGDAGSFIAGQDAGMSLIAGATNNVIIGALAANGPGITLQDDVVILGHQAAYLATGEFSKSVIIGKMAGDGYGNVTGNKPCILIGPNAGAMASIGNAVIIGHAAGNNASGSDGVVIGHGAGDNYATIEGAVYLGKWAGYGEQTDNKLHIANNLTESLIEGDFANKWVRINGATILSRRSIASGGNAIDVSGISLLSVDTSAMNRTIGGFTGGVEGQKLTILKPYDSFNLILEHRGLYGWEDIRTPDSNFFTIGSHGGVELIFEGGEWHIINEEKDTLVMTATSSDGFDVTGHSHISLITTSASVTIGGFINGVIGQRITLLKPDKANTLTIEHMEATGNEDISTTDGADIVMGPGVGGGVDLIYTGGEWIVL
jgi:hypothetical protein